MRRITITYKMSDVFDYCRGVTLTKVYDPTNRENNNMLSEIYGITIDEKEVFEKHCLKLACDYVYLAIKRHCWQAPNRPPFQYNILDNGTPVIKYRLLVGDTQDDIITDYMIMVIRDYAIKEWYKLKGNLEIAAFHENEYQENKTKLLDFTKGHNSDFGNINKSLKYGHPFN